MDEVKAWIEKLLNDPDLSEEELNQRQWQILEAAIQVFAEKGYEASRTIDIARQAEIAEGTIFRYFKTKKDLLIGLLFPLIIRVLKPILLKPVEEIMENRENLPIEAVLKNIYMDRLKLVRKNLPLIKAVMVEATYHPELLKPLQEEIVPRVESLVEGFIRKKIEEGIFRDLNPRLITRTFISLLAGYLILTQLFPHIFSLDEDEKELENIVDILLHGIRNRPSLGEGSPAGESGE